MFSFFKNLIFLVLLSFIVFSCQEKKIKANSWILDEIKQIDSLTLTGKDEALEHLLTISKDTLKLESKALYYYHLALYNLTYNYSNKETLNALKTSLTYSKQVENEYLIYKVKVLLGRYYAVNSNYPESLDYLLNALSYFERIQDSSNYSYVNNGLGIIYHDLQNYSYSEKYFKNALNGYELLNDNKGMALVSNNLSNLYSVLHKFEEALAYQRDALKKFEMLDDPTNIITSHLNILNIYLEQKNLDLASTYKDEATNWIKKTDSKRLQERYFFALGKLAYLQADYSTAIENFTKSYELAEENNFLTSKVDATYYMFLVAEQLDQTSSQLTYLKRFHTLNDSLHSIESRNKVQNIAMDYVFEKQKLEQQMIAEQYEFEKRTNKMYVLIACSILISISLLLYLLYRNKTNRLTIQKMDHLHLTEKTKRIQSELEKQNYNNELLSTLAKQKEAELELMNREIATSSLQLIAKNNLMKEIAEVLTKFKNSESLYMEIKNVLNKNNNNKKDWETFKNVFEKVHPTFFSSLKENYPDLSKTEIRVCAYIRINMSNTEIANAMNITQQSLIKSRYRIRVKMGLNSTYDLDTVLQKHH